MSNDDNGGLLEKALKNIENDRQRTSKLLTGLEEVLQCQPHDYKDLGTTAAKFVETLQRSNEQLVKLAALVHKKEAVNTQSGLSVETLQRSNEQLVKIVAMLNKDTPQESRTLSKEEKESLYNDLEEQK